MVPRRRSRAWLPLRLALLAVVAASALACGTQTPTASTLPAGSFGLGSSTNPGSNVEGLPSGAGSSVIASGDTPPYGGSGPVVIENMSAGLDALGSYRSRLVVSFAGSDVAAPSAWTMTVTVVRSDGPSATSVSVATTGTGAPLPDTLEVARDGQTYTSTNGACGARPTGEGASIIGLVSATGLLPSVVGATPAGHETVGGVEADHATFDEAAVGMAGVADGTGELWVAVAGGAVMKETLSLTGAGFPYGAATSGTMTWAYELTEAGSAVTIDLPVGCSTEIQDLPVPADATDVQRGPSVIAFNTPSTPAAVVAFYKDAGTVAGWTFTSTPYAAVDRGLIKATVAGRAITIVITGLATGSSVIVAAE